MRSWENIRIGDRFELKGPCVNVYEEIIISEYSEDYMDLLSITKRCGGEKKLGRLYKAQNIICGIDILSSLYIPKPLTAEDYRKRKEVQ